jgi:hypothetical protein
MHTENERKLVVAAKLSRVMSELQVEVCRQGFIDVTREDREALRRVMRLWDVGYLPTSESSPEEVAAIFHDLFLRLMNDEIALGPGLGAGAVS